MYFIGNENALNFLVQKMQAKVLNQIITNNDFKLIEDYLKQYDLIKKSCLCSKVDERVFIKKLRILIN